MRLQQNASSFPCGCLNVFSPSTVETQICSFHWPCPFPVAYNLHAKDRESHSLPISLSLWKSHVIYLKHSASVIGCVLFFLSFFLLGSLPRSCHSHSDSRTLTPMQIHAHVHRHTKERNRDRETQADRGEEGGWRERRISDPSSECLNLTCPFSYFGSQEPCCCGMSCSRLEMEKLTA